MTPADATAYSLDGRLFHVDAPLDAGLGIGMFVQLTDPRGTQIGQIEALEASERGGVRGTGTVLGALTSPETLDTRASHAFSLADVTEASASTTSLVYGGVAQGVRMGTLLANPSSDATLIPHRFNRHTFWCGQSGSGKTYALGVLLEQILIHTGLPVVILDPNSDFVRLREQRATPESATAEQRALTDRDIRVLRPHAEDADALRVRFFDLPIHAKAAVLRLDPLRDLDEYNELLKVEINSVIRQSGNLLPQLRERGPAAAALADRIENLRLVDWEVWAYEDRPVTDVVDERADATVLDLGGFSHPEEQLVVALSVLESLWARREERRPVLIVIDEAHNLCSPDTDSPLHVAVREKLIQIAAEGRKFGLWLLLSTQRPSKIHPNILSQCDNLALMRMNSPVDLEEILDVFGFAPREMVMSSPRFRQGEALFAGGFAAAPTLLKVGDRLTVEGGIDVPVPRR